MTWIKEISMAKFKSRKKEENYEPLHELLPLQAPFSILIDSSSICNFKCFYCPMSTDKQKDISKRVNGILLNYSENCR